MKTEPCDQNPLCELAKTKFLETDRRWEIKFQALESAIEKSEHILGLRLEEMNNFRKQIMEERIDFITRRETILLNFVISILVVIIGAVVTAYVVK